eukprot:jgi/Mesvir1/2286/Mv19323-RA.1
MRPRSVLSDLDATKVRGACETASVGALTMLAGLLDTAPAKAVEASIGADAEGGNIAITLLFTASAAGLVLVTAGVIYLNVADRMEKAEEEKAKEEALKSKAKPKADITRTGKSGKGFGE